MNMDFCRSTEQAGIITGSLYPKGNCSLSPSRELPPARNHNAFPKDFFPPFFVKRATNCSAISPPTNSYTLFLQPYTGIGAQANLSFSISTLMKINHLFVISVQCN